MGEQWLPERFTKPIKFITLKEFRQKSLHPEMIHIKQNDQGKKCRLSRNAIVLHC